MGCDDYDRMGKYGSAKGSVMNLLKQKSDKKKRDRKNLIIAKLKGDKDGRNGNEDT